jgi:hypothetical protein
MIIDFKKIMDTDISYFSNTFIFDESHHLNRQTGEHYKLLTYLSNLYDDILILDVGTCGGESAVALSQNRKNRVITYDIVKKWEVEDTTKMKENFIEQYDNLSFRLMDINSESPDVIKSASIIFFDIAHDGIQEKKFTDMLLNIGYKGYLICDDIFCPYYPNMKPWWDSIEIEKYDLTEVGHSWGSGLVNYHQDKNISIVK